MASLDQKLEQLITGEKQYHSSNLGLNLLISRLQKKYAGSGSKSDLSECMEEMKVFFDKYQRIMAQEMTAIENL